LSPASTRRKTSVHLEAINGHDQRAAELADNPSAELAERRKVLELGLERLGQSPAASAFEGKALRNGSEAIEGSFLVAGALGLFAAKNGKFRRRGHLRRDRHRSCRPSSPEGQRQRAIAKASFNRQRHAPDRRLHGQGARSRSRPGLDHGDHRKRRHTSATAILGLGAISLLIAFFKAIEVTRFPVPNRGTDQCHPRRLLARRREDATAKRPPSSGMAGELVTTAWKTSMTNAAFSKKPCSRNWSTIKPRLDRFLPFLGLTAAAAPLMGLLGTVLGIIKTFQAMAIYGTGNAKNFSAGISEALITTAQGLIVAIPVLVIHGILKSLVKGKFGEVEGIAIALVNGTSERERSDNQADGEEADDDDIKLRESQPRLIPPP
jgi:biopolymer transport protein ExbB